MGIGKLLSEFKNDGGMAYEHFCGAAGAGFYVAESGQEGCEAFGFCGEEKCGFGVVSLGLESDLHERACLLCE
jgi:hypothetical protein